MQPSRPSATSEDRPNPFPYGWRYISATQPDGSTRTVQAPLTLADVLHPKEGDVIPESRHHQVDRRYLSSVIESRLKHPPIVTVTSDLLIDWGITDLKPMAPDVGAFVALKTEPSPREGTFHLRDSGGRCLLLAEVVSPSTRDNDVKEKLRLYHQAKVPLYLLVDQHSDDGPRQLLAYEWSARGFVRQPLDAQGRYLVKPLGLYVSLANDRVVCHDAETGRELGDYSAISLELEEADRRIQAQERELEESILQLRQTAVARDKAEDLAKREAERAAEAEKLAKTEAERAAEAEKLAQAEADRAAEAEQSAKREADRAAEAEKLAKTESDRAAKALEELGKLQQLLAQLTGGTPPST